MNGLLHAHSGLRWAVLALLLFSIIKGLTSANKPYSKGLYAATMGTVHIQVILGLILYVNNVLPAIKNAGGFGEVMKNADLRFLAVEHITMMVLAAIIATVGYSLGKRKPSDAQKHKTTAVFFIISLLLILAAIPWASRPMF